MSGETPNPGRHSGESTETAQLLEAIVGLAERAGAEILEVYAAEDAGARRKADDSPVTEADLRAEAVIVKGLEALTPRIPVVAEEQVAAGGVPDPLGSRFWLVDPLDGTKEFLSRNGEFTVNIALVDQGAPVLGVVHAPVLSSSWVGGPDGARMTSPDGATDLAVVPAPAEGYRVLVSRSHLDEETTAWLETVRVSQRVQAGSSLKFCRIAEGKADLYPRFGRTMAWDTAAAHAVLVAAGGSVRTVDGVPLRYGPEAARVGDGGRGPGDELANPSFVAAGADPVDARSS